MGTVSLLRLEDAHLHSLAWTGRPPIHWLAPCVGLAIIGAAILPPYLAISAYMADVYEGWSSSALACQSLCRNVSVGAMVSWRLKIVVVIRARADDLIQCLINRLLSQRLYMSTFLAPQARASSTPTRWPAPCSLVSASFWALYLSPYSVMVSSCARRARRRVLSGLPSQVKPLDRPLLSFRTSRRQHCGSKTGSLRLVSRRAMRRLYLVLTLCSHNHSITVGACSVVRYKA